MDKHKFDQNNDEYFYRKTIQQYIDLARDCIAIANPEKIALPTLNKLPDDIRKDFMDQYESMMNEWEKKKQNIERQIEELQRRID